MLNGQTVIAILYLPDGTQHFLAVVAPHRIVCTMLIDWLWQAAFSATLPVFQARMRQFYFMNTCNTEAADIAHKCAKYKTR